MSEQGYGDTVQEFNDACLEHGHRRSAKRTSLPYYWVVLKSALRRLANKTARRLDVSIIVKTIRHERKQCWNMLPHKLYCKLPEACLYFFLWRQKCHQFSFSISERSLKTLWMKVTFLVAHVHERIYIFMWDTKCTNVIRTNKMHTFFANVLI